jgi:hypothetical protein
MRHFGTLGNNVCTDGCHAGSHRCCGLTVVAGSLPYGSLEECWCRGLLGCALLLFGSNSFVFMCAVEVL